MPRETNGERFIRVVETRTNKAIDAIERIGDCADVRIYEYSPEQVEKIFLALENAVEVAKQRFYNGSGRKYVFLLDDTAEGDNAQ